MDWESREIPGGGEIAQGLEWKTVEWTGGRKSFSYFGYRFVGMPARLAARFGIPPAILRSTAGGEVVTRVAAANIVRETNLPPPPPSFSFP